MQILPLKVHQNQEKQSLTYCKSCKEKLKTKEEQENQFTKTKTWKRKENQESG